MAVTHHKSSRTIRGKTYAYGAKFVCYAANKGTGGSEGNGGSAAALTKGETYIFKGYATNDSGALTSYPYLVADGLGNTRGWYRENVFPYATYAIVYNANGGTGAPSAQTKTHGTAITLSSTKPTRSGYTFQGWGTSTSDTTVDYAAGASYTANAGITLYAIWKANTYTVTYNANGGTGAPGNQTKTHGVNLVLSGTKPTRTNYIFKGWGTSSTTSAVSYAAGATYTGNTGLTLYAIWELDYVKPRITTFSVKRCNSLGEETIDGRYVHVTYNWATDKEVTSVVIKWKLSTESTYPTSNTKTVTASGTSGGALPSITIIGNNAFSPESTYDIQLVVTDASGSTNVTKTLASIAYTIHAKSGGDGIAFGKTSELSGVADFAFKVKFGGGMIHPVIPPETDFDTLITPNIYIGMNRATINYNNCPITSGTFILEVTAAGDETQIRQRLQYCNKDTSVIYERFYYSGSFGSWYEAEGVKSALTVGLSAKITLGVLNSYTKVPFNTTVYTIGSGFTMSDGCILVGKGVRRVRLSAQLKINCGGTACNRHVKLCRVRNGTITYLTWNNEKMAASYEATLTVSPIIVDVAEGDLLQMLFYTSDTSDANNSGSSGGGWQTYMTAESI